MYPKVNQNIMIDIKSQDQSCRSIIAEVRENEILIGFPMDRNIIGLLTDGTQVDIIFMADEHQYKFQAEIIGRKKDNIPLCRITKPQEKEIIRIQRRDNFRVNSNLLLRVNGNKLNTINISAGGILFSCGMEMDLQHGEVVAGSLMLSAFQSAESSIIPFKGQIIRIHLIKDLDRKNIAMKFIEMDKRDQMKIIQHCFEKQRQMRLKSL
ncbi:flagellar brake protein [Neobacillus drentensis]|uniref:flagellar brake protein n=1 Tax=Neobacillus drentensis TaxID=220684 RepID=UPI00285F8743|nr:flagellar brake domain-containing protein [Neobacillus drentensis]MDR7235708.1 c-di-GMP-binding flagellar brake protein YcgR [Neobacillus drentensis]